MIGFLIRLLVSVVTLFIVAHFSDGAVQLKSVLAGVIAAIVIGMGNALVKPILYWIGKKVTCALNCITLGLWSLILSWLISGTIFYLAGQWLSGFEVTTFKAALLGALVLAIVNSIASVATRSEIFKKRGDE